MDFEAMAEVLGEPPAVALGSLPAVVEAPFKLFWRSELPPVVVSVYVALFQTLSVPPAIAHPHMV